MVSVLRYFDETRGWSAVAPNSVFSYLYTPEQFGAKGDGSTDDTASFSKALAAAAGGILQLSPYATYLTDPVVISQTNANAPQIFIGNGAKLKARAASANPLLTIENVQGLLHNFQLDGVSLDANGLHAQALKIHGSQQATYSNIRAINGTAGGVWLSGEPGFGIYYSTFMNIEAEFNTGPGFIMKSINNVGQYYIAADNFLGLRSAANTTYGYDLDFMTGGFLNCEAETNSTCGVNIDNSIDVCFYSLYTEANSTPDCSFIGTVNSKGVRVYGGRMPGTISSSLLNNSANSWDTSDANAAPLIYPRYSSFSVVGTVNFNVANTDTSFTISLPFGSRYRVLFCVISGASTSLTTATAGLFTATGGGGIQIVTGGSAITVNTSTENTNNNTQFMGINNLTSQSYNATTLFFRVGTAEGVTATGNVELVIQPLS